MSYHDGMALASRDLECERKLSIDAFEVGNVIEKHVPGDGGHRPGYGGLMSDRVGRGAAVEKVQTLAFQLLHDAAHGLSVLRQETAGVVVEPAQVRN